MPGSPEFQFYSQRLLHPFRGIRCVMAADDMQAVTTNAKTWLISVSDTGMNAFVDVNDTVPFHTSVIRYAKWSRQHGLQTEPMVTLVDYAGIARRVDKLIDVLEKHAAEIPYAFNDVFELWLLDEQLRPLALLQSAAEWQQLLQRESLRWRYTSVPGMSEDELRRLMFCVEQASGKALRAVWLRRSGDSGFTEQGVNVAIDELPRQWPVDSIPELLLNEGVLGEEGRRLAQRYHQQLAPWLLMLDGLSPWLRENLETMASEQAMHMARLFPLYPQVLDETRLTRVRVEAQLRNRYS